MNDYYSKGLLTAFAAASCAVLVVAWLALVAVAVGVL